jgi:hypothetical protein
MEGSADEQDRAFGLFEVGNSGFEGVVGADGVDFNDRFKRIWREILPRVSKGRVEREGVLWGGTSMVARKFPAAPAMTKSSRPNSLIVVSTAASMDFISRTSAETARHLAPFLSPSISFAIAYNQSCPVITNKIPIARVEKRSSEGPGESTVGCRRPQITAFAPSETSALTWTLQIVPPPPVQKTTAISFIQCLLYPCP